MSELFGADSAKGIAVADLTCEIAMQAGRASAAVLARGQGKKSKIIVGKDGKRSSDILEAAVCAGICSAGADAECVGAVPAPAAAWLVKEHSADACIMITAASGGESSGITIFSPEGRRFGRDIEDQIESRVFGIGAGSALALPRAEIGRMIHSENAADEYIEHIRSLIDTDFTGLRVAVCCLESCAAVTAERLFTALGAEVIMLEETDNDFASDIDLGSTSYERLMELTAASGCDCGLYFTTDGCGCLAADENGNTADGDTILAILAKYYKERGRLKNDTVAVNIMSGLGLFNFARDNGMTLRTSGAVGRHVLDRMLEEHCALGGEKSGHIIFLDDSPLADGQLCGARLLEALKYTGKRFSELAGEMEKLPQIVLNVRISPRKREIWKNDEVITGLIREKEELLGTGGRILVREAASSDPFIRVMIEGHDFSKINEMAVEVARKIKERCSPDAR